MVEGKVCSRQSAVRRGGSVDNMQPSGLLTYYLYFNIARYIYKYFIV
jgi:hypothetical protein